MILAALALAVEPAEPAPCPPPEPVTSAFEVDYADPGIGARWPWGSLHLQGFGTAVAGLRAAPSDNLGPSHATIVLDLFLTGSFLGRGQVLWEALTSPGPGGLSAPYSHRLWVAVTVAEPLHLKLGAEHLPISWWNRHYHHGAWLTTTIERPYLARFEDDGLFQPHGEGLELLGRVPVGPGGLEYTINASVAEPLPRYEAPVAPGFELGRDTVTTAALAWESHQAVALRLGAAVSRGGIAPLGGARPIVQWAESAHVVVRAARLELVVEGALVMDRAGPEGPPFWSHSAYAQGAWRVGRLTPYLRLDYRAMARGDPYYAAIHEPGRRDGRDLDRWEARGGLRWDVSRNIAIKLEGAGGQQELHGPAGGVSPRTGGALATELALVF